jgi:threonylcarbamoyladenosine tRNA methylthiotransferase MtaB
MKRRHTRDQAIDLCGDLKKHRPEIALGADFIVGFPGETDAMFQETFDSVMECSLTHLHVFPFSKRPGTLAALMDHQVPPSIITERAKILREHGHQQLEQWLSQHKGKTLTILAEQTLKGHSDDFSEVRFTQSVPANTLITGVVTETKKDHLVVTHDFYLQQAPQFV